MSDEKVTEKKVTNLSKLLKQKQHPDKFYLKIFKKLDGYSVSISILKNTGIGKLINSFKSHESSEVVESSKNLVRKWKKQVEPSVEKSTPEKTQKKKKVEPEKPQLVYFYQPNIKKSKPAANGKYTKAGNVWGIFSGNRHSHKGVVSLKELAMRVLVQNYDSIYQVGTLTCEHLKPALLKCNAEQLNLIEHRNNHLRGTLESIWKKLVEGEFHANALIGSSWKDMYWDKVMERKEKLKKLTNTITSAKLQKEKNVSAVMHIQGPTNLLAKSRGVKRSLNHSSSHSDSSSSSSKRPLMKRCLEESRYPHKRGR